MFLFCFVMSAFGERLLYQGEGILFCREIRNLETVSFKRFFLFWWRYPKLEVQNFQTFFSQSIINIGKVQICIQLYLFSTLLLSFRWLFMPIWPGALTNEQLTNLQPCFTHFHQGYPSWGYHFHLSPKKLRTQFLFSFCFQCDNCPERLATTWGSGPTLPPLQRWNTIWTNICPKYFLVIDKRLKCI